MISRLKLMIEIACTTNGQIFLKLILYYLILEFFQNQYIASISLIVDVDGRCNCFYSISSIILIVNVDGGCNCLMMLLRSL
jgi:hypothetical protein